MVQDEERAEQETDNRSFDRARTRPNSLVCVASVYCDVEVGQKIAQAKKRFDQAGNWSILSLNWSAEVSTKGNSSELVCFLLIGAIVFEHRSSQNSNECVPGQLTETGRELSFRTNCHRKM